MSLVQLFYLPTNICMVLSSMGIQTLILIFLLNVNEKIKILFGHPDKRSRKLDAALHFGNVFHCISQRVNHIINVKYTKIDTWKITKPLTCLLQRTGKATIMEDTQISFFLLSNHSALSKNHDGFSGISKN